MGQQFPMDVQQAFHDVVFDFGVDKLAAMMSMSRGTLYNKCNSNENENNHNKPTVRDLVLATLLTGDKRIAQAFSRTVGGAHVELPDLSSLSTDTLMLHILKIEHEGGDFYRVLHQSLEKDDSISADEFTAIEKEAHEWIAAILEGLVRMKEMSGGAK
jgi:hypothetical protein